MSTWLHLVCLDHTPPLVADDESGQHLYDLPQLRADIANRDDLLAVVRVNDGDVSQAFPDTDDVDNYFRRHTVRFLTAHPTCRLGIRDEYGHDHAITEPVEEAL